MGQAQNGRLYIKYRSSFQKKKTNRRCAKSLQTTSICNSNAKSTLKVTKAKHKNLNFVHFLYRKGPDCLMCQITGKCPVYCSGNLSHSNLFWGSCELWVVSYGPTTVPKSLCALIQTLLGFSHNNFVGVACIVRSHLDYWVCACKSSYCMHSIQVCYRTTAMF